jgi:hypothetical protein
MYAKKWRARTRILNGDERGPTRRRSFAVKNSSQLPDGGSFEKRSQWKLNFEYLFNFGEKVNGQDRVSAKIEVILVKADRLNAK